MCHGCVKSRDLFGSSYNLVTLRLAVSTKSGVISGRQFNFWRRSDLSEYFIEHPKITVASSLSGVETAQMTENN
jgi:hypothetical protein